MLLLSVKYLSTLEQRSMLSRQEFILKTIYFFNIEKHHFGMMFLLIFRQFEYLFNIDFLKDHDNNIIG